MGLDLSTRAAACVVVPYGWQGNWKDLRSAVFGEPLARDATDQDRALRCGSIASQIVAFALVHGVGTVWIESYAYNQNKSAHTLGELGGVVRLELVLAGLDVQTANMTSARSLLLGRLPRRKGKRGPSAKDAVKAALGAAGASFATLDEYDAFVVANWGQSEAGRFCFAQRKQGPP